MRWRSTLAFGLSLAAAAATAHGQAMSSSELVPPTAAEAAELARAARDVLPSDVRRDPARHAARWVFWTGTTSGIEDGVAMVEHHYFDGRVEGGGGVWLSPWGEGRFCVLGLPPAAAERFRSEHPLFVRAYGHPVMTERGLCLSEVFLVVGDRSWSTTFIEYGPGGKQGFSEDDAAARGAFRSHPEARLLTPFGYRLLAGAQLGKTNLDDSPVGTGWNAALELSLRSSLRTELALMGGPHAYPEFDAPTSVSTALLFRYFTFGIGIAAGPLVHLPVGDDERVWLGVRYLPSFGDALGSWGLSPVLGGGADISFTTDGDARFLLNLTLGLDGNLGSLAR